MDLDNRSAGATSSALAMQPNQFPKGLSGQINHMTLKEEPIKESDLIGNHPRVNQFDNNQIYQNDINDSSFKNISPDYRAGNQMIPDNVPLQAGQTAISQVQRELLENNKIRLTKRPDFNLIDAFRIFDVDGNGQITSEEIYDGITQVLECKNV